MHSIFCKPEILLPIDANYSSADKNCICSIWPISFKHSPLSAQKEKGNMTKYRTAGGAPSHRFNVVIATLLSIFWGASGQTEICGCAPSSYVFTLDFSLLCQSYNVSATGDGITDFFCEMSLFGGPEDDITDLVPVSESMDSSWSGFMMALTACLLLRQT
jgi:hypothetical protein